MLQVLRSDMKWGSLEDIPSRTTTLVDVISPTDKELVRLSEISKIPINEFKEAIDPDERPRVSQGENYSLIIFRAPYRVGKKIYTTPVSIFLFNHSVICFRHTKLKVFEEDLYANIEKRKQIFDKGAWYLCYWIIDDILNSFFSFMDLIEDKINKTEDMIYNSADKKILQDLFNYKKVLIYFHKALTANREVISSIEKRYLKHFPEKELHCFRYTYNDVVELLDMESTYRDILTGAMDMYLTSVSNNLNIIIKKMTAMGSFILIPTLISGIYGMNFHYLPELQWKYGYFFSLGLMALSVVALYFYFKKKEWL
ncbi:MAG: magnesium/cobalt transporter CorA [Candidatus Woesearchaeota archaeon]